MEESGRKFTTIFLVDMINIILITWNNFQI